MDTILEGLQIANGVLSIGTNVQAIRKGQGDIEANDYKERGGLTKDQEIEARSKFNSAQPTDAGAINMGIVRDEQGKESPLFVTTKAQKTTPMFKTIENYKDSTTGQTGTLVKDLTGTKPDQFVAQVPKPGITPYEQARLAQEQQRLELAKGQATGDKAGKVYSEMINHIETPRGNSAVQQAQKNLLSAETANGLISQYPDLNAMPPDKVNLLNAEIAKIAQGGVASDHSQRGLEQNTLQSKFAIFMQQVGNQPSGAQLGAFIQQNKDYLDDVTKVNQAQVNRYKLSIYNGYRGRLTPEQDAQFKTEYPDLFAAPQAAKAVAAGAKAGEAIAAPQQGAAAAPAADLHPQADAARDWATKNVQSKDAKTRAKAEEILRRLGPEAAAPSPAPAQPSGNSLGNRYRGNRG
jgi:hypothetical protein